ncbi:MAG: YdcF family protein [Alphaproteobacteria bacterium]|nr:YdcF family protein [Alphaproteobacteria bacterium]
MRAIGLLFLVFLSACAMRARPITWPSTRTVDVVLVPGCPTRDDGSLSKCQWQRVVWAAQLYDEGVTDAFIVSGGAVHNRYIEAEALEAGLVALGVPAGRIHRETQALHSDENAAYTLAMMDELGFHTLGIASHTGHANGIRTLVRAWGAGPAVSLEVNGMAVSRRIRRGLPEVRVEPVPAHEWLPLEERERVIAERLGTRRRPASMWEYPRAVVAALFASEEPPAPPVKEPSLRGLRHRVDTDDWHL